MITLSCWTSDNFPLLLPSCNCTDGRRLPGRLPPWLYVVPLPLGLRRPGESCWLHALVKTFLPPSEACVHHDQPLSTSAGPLTGCRLPLLHPVSLMLTHSLVLPLRFTTRIVC